ncbi:MAG: anthranilate synthase component I family protein, partial [Sphingobacteriales bacterium]
SGNHDSLGFPEMYFFAPKYLVCGDSAGVEIIIGDRSIIETINKIKLRRNKNAAPSQTKVNPRITKQAYLEKIEKLKKHINRGDVYEVNFCQEFFSENATIDPISLFQELNHISPTPFAGYFKLHDHYILSATPERFLTKKGNKLISQPIKGTARRSADPLEDESIKKQLRSSKKEQAENIMIVDLVRNDLTRSAQKGTVKVEELLGLYSFKQVHQLISTVSCILDGKVHFIDAIKNSFPMGSMTGAPKYRAMELIEDLEETKRGIYSGTMGYITPGGDFDLNVVIRSILYNSSTKYLSFQVGGAITNASDPENEYNECLVKASAILQVLEGPSE